jgi:hypothetical protein
MDDEIRLRVLCRHNSKKARVRFRLPKESCTHASLEPRMIEVMYDLLVVHLVRRTAQVQLIQNCHVFGTRDETSNRPTHCENPLAKLVGSSLLPLKEHSDCPMGGVVPLPEKPLATADVDGVVFIWRKIEK